MTAHNLLCKGRTKSRPWARGWEAEGQKRRRKGEREKEKMFDGE